MRPSTDGRDRRNARGRATIQAIERAAVCLAAEDGVDALTVDRICAVVGITQRSFFNHFDAKEDALLGWELPQLDEARVAAYLADPAVGVLTGALGLVRMPAELTERPELAAARMQVLLAAAPELVQRQVQRMLPIARQVEEVVAHKLAHLPGGPIDPAALRGAAATITSMAATLIAAPGTVGGVLGPPDPDHAQTALADLRWVWSRLL